MLIVGLIVGGSQGTLMIGTGLALGSLGGLELSIREHFAGFRSHTTLLAGAVGVVIVAALSYADPDSLPPAGRVGVGAAVGALCAFALVRSFKRRAGVNVKFR